MYGRTPAVRDLSFQVRPGEVVGFLGPNGAGKSTTLRILTGLLAATSGEAWINGISVAREPSAIKRQIGYMAENNPLPEDFRVSEYLRFRARLKGVPRRELRSHLDSILETCDLHRKARRKVIGALSKGFRQRVGIADALIGNPQITIMDEPTIGLDPHQVILIRDLIQNLRGRTTVLLSSHILSEVEVCCDRVLILNQGRLVASGTPAELRETFVPGATYRLEVIGQRTVLESLLQKYAADWRHRFDQTDDPKDLRLRISTDERDQEDPTQALTNAIHANPELTLRAWHKIDPNLEDIFLIATRRSWELSEEALRDKNSGNQPEVIS
ncbi:MAG: ABC transporter ATP-binding protein [Opitutales bacterium]|nr:ABC transporter ATP-binding protein [Opitutales bacterium]